MRVFVSSTSGDLKEYRNNVLDALLWAGCMFEGMEYFGADAREPLEICLNRIDDSDLVVCIVGTWYGSRPTGSTLSFTEHEVDHALASNKDVLAFLFDWSSPLAVPDFVADGEDRVALARFKKKLLEKVTVVSFTTPTDLKMKVGMALMKSQTRATGEAHAILHDRMPARYRETCYDSIADWYDYWYFNHWRDEQPFETLRAAIASHSALASLHPSNVRVLDVACGTGNTYSSFKRAGFDVYGCDGSQKMLNRAIENCKSVGISYEGIIQDPINWTDGEEYRRIFGKKKFDVIINTANSFCHIPAVAEYMDRALANFKFLLGPNGLLIIDTKKYVQEGDLGGVPIYKELRLEGSEWIIRTVRDDPPRDVPGLGLVQFHTNLHYDVDPAFSEKVPRALIVFTVYGEGLPPQTALIPYYPLPATELDSRMSAAGFATTVYPAKQGLAKEWKYDLLVGRKEG